MSLAQEHRGEEQTRKNGQCGSKSATAEIADDGLEHRLRRLVSDSKSLGPSVTALRC